MHLHPVPRLPGGPRETASGPTDVCVCAALRLLTRFCSRELSRALLPQELNIADFHLLVALRDQPLPQMVLARTLHLDPAAVSRLVASAARCGNIVPASKGLRPQWRLSHYGTSVLEVVSIAWESVDESIRRFLGAEVVSGLVQRAERLPPRHREPSGVWRDD